jgi:maleylpyruvate isomerase
MLTLYDYFRSSACFRVRIALNLKGLAYQTIPIHLVKEGGEQYSPAYQRINPQQLVPTLQEGDKLLTQSLAIIEYLNDCHPAPQLLPTDPYQKALVRAFALAIAADMHPLNNLRVLTYLTKELAITDEQKNTWYQHWMTKGLSALESYLNKHSPSSDFCFGDTPTLADICLVPQLFNARRFACDLSAYPRLVSIDQHCQTFTAFINAKPTETTVT